MIDPQKSSHSNPVLHSPGLRVLKAVGETSLWKRVGRVHGWLYRVTGGTIGQSAGRITNLLLTTIGRKSGEPRTVTLAYLADGDSWLLVASNGGSDHPPAWWLNLRDRPEATIQVGKERIPVVAREADESARARLWPMLTRWNPIYSSYERITARRIPIVILQRAAVSAARG